MASNIAGYGQEIVETLAEYSGVPVWNGLTDEFHPTQMIADLLTIRENFGDFQGLNLVFMGRCEEQRSEFAHGGQCEDGHQLHRMRAGRMYA